MSKDTIYREDAIKAVKSSIADGWGRISPVDACQNIRCLPSTDKPQEWIPCSERLPDACKDVLLTCEVRPINHKPFRYVCTAQWIPKFCEEALGIDWDEEITEYCEEDDEFYPLEGWYESISNWDDYSLVGIGDFAIAWKPLPEPWKGADDE